MLPPPTTASPADSDAERLAVPPDSTPAPTAAAWLLAPEAPPESPLAVLIRKWTTEPEWTPDHDQL